MTIPTSPVVLLCPPNFVRDKPYCFTWRPNHKEHHQSLMLRVWFLHLLSRFGFEPRTFGLAYLCANRETTAALYVAGWLAVLFVLTVMLPMGLLNVNYMGLLAEPLRVKRSIIDFVTRRYLAVQFCKVFWEWDDPQEVGTPVSFKIKASFVFISKSHPWESVHRTQLCTPKRISFVDYLFSNNYLWL